MSNGLGRTQSRNDARSLPKGEPVGRYASYLDAQKAVDYLADQQFAVQNVSIIGNDLKTVERVTGRLSYPRVALSSAATGAWFGFFVGLVLMLFGGNTDYTSVLSTMALGAGFWLLFGIITYAFQRGKRDFTSTSQVVATNYDVIVDPQVIGEARRLLQEFAAAGGPPVAGSPLGGNPGAGRAPAGPQEAPHAPAANPQVPSNPQVPQEPARAPQPSSLPDSSQPEAGNAGAHAVGSNGSSNPANGQESLGSDHRTPADGQGTQEGQSRRGQFPDLADGRPQYGIRVPEKDADGSAQE